MRNEDFRQIGIRGAGNCTQEQRDYAREWKRAAPIYRGQDRPWAIISFRLSESMSRNRSPRSRPSLTSAIRFVDVSQLEVVTMTRRPEADAHRRPGKQWGFAALVQSPYVDERGNLCVGGSQRRIVREFDFSRTPYQDHQVFLEIDHTGPIVNHGPPGVFCVRRSDLWVDLCVGHLPASNEPCAVFRLSLSDVDRGLVEICDHDNHVEPGNVLGMANSSVRVGRAAFDAKSRPLVDRIGSGILCAKRVEEPRGKPNVLFRMLNRMNEWMNDLTLLPSDERPTVVPIETWAPRVMVELPPGVAEQLTNLSGYEHTPYLKDAARRALDPDGSYCIRARHSGKIDAIAPAKRQRHLLQVTIGGHAQSLPAAATLLDHLDVGSEVAVGEPIADFCPRIQLATWREVRDFLDVGTSGEPIDLGVADWIYLPDFLAQEVIRPGSNDWNGPGDLIDARYLTAAVVQPSWRRYLDLEPCLPWLDEEHGFIVCPPIFHPDWDEMTVEAKGVMYVFGAADIWNGRVGQLLRRNRRKRRSRRPTASGVAAAPGV